MSFWTDGRIEPKRQNRWVVQFDGVHTGNMYFATKVTRPSVEISKKEHKFLNHTFNYPGRATWAPITLTMVDTAGGGTIDAGDNTMKSLMQILTDSGYMVPNTVNSTSLKTISKSNAINSLSSAPPDEARTGTKVDRPTSNGITIKMIDAEGNTIETWLLKNAFVTKITPSELSYEEDGIATVDMELSYDYCVFDDTFFTPR